jgi:hypothetical protein
MMAAISEGEVFNYSLCAGPIKNCHLCHLESKLFCSINWKGLIKIILSCLRFRPFSLVRILYCVTTREYHFYFIDRLKAYSVQHCFLQLHVHGETY